MEKKEASVYLAPHQDDELTNLGVDLCREAAGGKEVWCLLFTDGSSSFVRTFLANREPCPLHEGRHVYPMDRAEFARARDREFLSSLGAMGVMPERAVILPGRAQDGLLSKERAKELLLAFLTALPGREITLKSVMPMRSVRQNPDHTALALAAEEVFREGKAAALEFFYEMIHEEYDVPEKEGLIRLTPSEKEKRRLLKAARAYGTWNPEEGFFAIGYHSVKDEFDAFIQDPHALVRREA